MSGTSVGRRRWRRTPFPVGFPRPRQKTSNIQQPTSNNQGAMRAIFGCWMSFAECLMLLSSLLKLAGRWRGARASRSGFGTDFRHVGRRHGVAGIAPRIADIGHDVGDLVVREVSQRNHRPFIGLAVD